jgi:hypothetical protein
MNWLTFFEILLGLLGLLLLALAWEIVQILRASVPACPHIVHLGSIQQSDTAAPPIPKIIWTYWHALPEPEFIQQCLANWRRFAPGHELRVLHKDSIFDWLDSTAITAQFEQLPPFRQADWLRLQLLAKHGGIWIDASTLLTRNLEWVHMLQAEKGSEYVGFYIDRFTTRPEQPIVENWFMAAIPRSRFIETLAQEFDHALRMGEARYLQKLQDTGKLNQVVQGLGPKDQLYLIMHVAAAFILDSAQDAYRLSLIRAEDSALGFHAALKWRKRHLYARLALSPAPRNLPWIIKLRGGDRRIFERGWTRGWVFKGSALFQLFETQKHLEP